MQGRVTPFVDAAAPAAAVLVWVRRPLALDLCGHLGVAIIPVVGRPSLAGRGVEASRANARRWLCAVSWADKAQATRRVSGSGF